MIKAGFQISGGNMYYSINDIGTIGWPSRKIRILPHFFIKQTPGRSKLLMEM